MKHLYDFDRVFICNPVEIALREECQPAVLHLPYRDFLAVYCTDMSDGSAEISRDFTESEKVNSRLISITRRCRQQNG